MVQILEKKEVENLVADKEIFLVIPEQRIETVKKEEQKPRKKSRLFMKHKKAICIDKIKRNLNSSVYRNRFVMR